MGLGPKILETIVKNQVDAKKFISTSIRFSSLIVIPLLLCIYFLPIDKYIFDSIMSEKILTLALVESFVMGVTTEIIFTSLQGFTRFNFLSNISFLLTVLLGPTRIILLLVLNLSVYQWLIYGLMARLLILTMSLIFLIKLSKTHHSGPQSNRSVMGKWNYYLLYPLIFWVCGSLDRILMIGRLPEDTNENYQVAFQTTSIVGLLLGQIALLNTSQILKSDEKSSRANEASLIEGFLLATIVCTYPCILLYTFISKGATQIEIVTLVLLLNSQLLWGLIQIFQMRIGSRLGLSHLLPIAATIAGFLVMVAASYVIESSSVIGYAILPNIFFGGIVLTFQILFARRRISIVRTLDRSHAFLIVIFLILMGISPLIVSSSLVFYVYPFVYLLIIFVFRKRIIGFFNLQLSAGQSGD